jgi:hypothetical protein
MPEIIACPDCGRKLRVPDDLLGRKVKCPGCGVNFTASVIGGGPPPVPQQIGTAPRPQRRDDRYDDDRPRRRRDEYDDDVEQREPSPRALRESWKKVRAGISWVIISIWVFLGAVGVSFIGGLLIGAATGSSTSLSSAISTATTGGLVLTVFLDLIYLVEQGFKVTGFGFGLLVPPKRNNPVRGLAIATFIVGATGAGLFLVAKVIDLVVGVETVTSGYSPMALVGGSGVMGVLAFLVLFASFVVYLFYLRFLCLAVRKDGVAATVTSFLISVGALAIVFFLIMLLVMFMVGASLDAAFSGNAFTGRSFAGAVLIGAALMCLWFLAALALFIWYIVILHQVRGAVDIYIRKQT